MRKLEHTSQITTRIPTDLKDKAVKLNISYAKAATLGLQILIKQEESIAEVVEKCGKSLNTE